MILNEPQSGPAPPGLSGRSTLDELFCEAVLRRPGDTALIDPPDRESFTDGAPRRLTYAEADRMISAIAGRLRRIGLNTDAIVGLQIANTVENVLTLLAVLRAGLIAMPLPLLWRRAEATAALGRVGANALIVSGRVGMVDHFDLAMQVGAEIFSIRYVCGFGCDPPDGLIPLDDLYTAAELDPLPSIERERALPPGPGAHLAVITWDVTPDGLVPVARSHAELIAGGVAVLLEGRFEQDTVVLSTLTMSSFAGLAVALIPWLMSGGTLALHHPFDPETFLAQRRSIRCDTVIVPGPLVAELAKAGQLSAADGLKRVLGVWRAPERLPRAPTWRDGTTALTDVQVFGETGLIAAGRGPGGRPGTILFGPVVAPRGASGAMIVAEVQPSGKGTVALRGPMVPRCPFPPGAERAALPHLKIDVNGFVDTGYGCRSEDSPAMTVTGPPPGIVSVGGYRFVARDLQDTVRGVEGDASLAALPDALAGHRLAGNAPDRDSVQEALIKLGANPLLVGAFGGRKSEIGSQKSEAGSQKPERPRLSDF